ncbi:MAG: hypothetical protein IJ343_04845 [Clostridia bacterium]|nr:hypothetical protein [Clostridia bacterium]
MMKRLKWMAVPLTYSVLMVLSLFAARADVGVMVCGFSAPVMIPLVMALGSIDAVGAGWRMHIGFGLTLVQAAGVIAAPVLASFRQYWLFLALQVVGMICRIAVCAKMQGGDFVMSVWGCVLHGVLLLAAALICRKQRAA